VAYDRERLEAVRDLWSQRFEEPAVHEALRDRFGLLWLTPDSEVGMRRTVSLGAALRERYAFGRIFGQTRSQRMTARRRALYGVVAPALPLLLLGRMTAKGLRSEKLARNFLRGFFPLVGLVLCWSFGEWLGYVTGRPPGSLVLAAERTPADSSADQRSRQ
jgi:hypothetical protein